MDPFGTALTTLVLFVGFGFMVGVLFGFFGMGRSFLYGMEGSVDLSIVAPLLAGSALGARIGSASTSIVNEDDIKIYFGLMLLGGSIAVAFQQAGDYLAIGVFNTIGFALILLSAFTVSGAVIYSTVTTIRKQPNASAASAD